MGPPGVGGRFCRSRDAIQGPSEGECVPLQLPAGTGGWDTPSTGRQPRVREQNTCYSTVTFPKSLTNIFPHAVTALLFQTRPILPAAPGFTKPGKLSWSVQVGGDVPPGPGACLHKVNVSMLAVQPRANLYSFCKINSICNIKTQPLLSQTNPSSKSSSGRT